MVDLIINYTLCIDWKLEQLSVITPVGIQIIVPNLTQSQPKTIKPRVFFLCHFRVCNGCMTQADPSRADIESRPQFRSNQ